MEKVKSSPDVFALVPPVVVTDTFTVLPAAPAGLTATISVELLTDTLAAGVEPNRTVAPLAKPVP